MLIDGFTVVAQVCNFLILVWLLKRFLYRPVLAAIDAREQKIGAQLEASAAQAALAKQQSIEWERRNQTFQTEREALFRKAIDEAAEERRRLIEEARNDALAQRRKEAETLARERAELSMKLVGQAQSEVLAVTRDVLITLADARLEDRITAVFLRRLADLPDTQKQLMMHSLATERLIRVRSAFELTPAERDRLEAALRESFGPELDIQFEIDSKLVCGLELTLGAHKVEWSVAGYLESFADTVLSTLDAHATAGATSDQ
jgi:F-type H+-transporting ATPase subunit b